MKQEFTAQIGNIPDELKAINAWVGYKVRQKDSGKIDKIPINAMTGTGAKSNDDTTWASYDAAVAMATKRDDIYGIGFMLHAPYIGVDLDHCVKDDGTVEGWAVDIINKLNSYTEYSPSMTGIRIICKGMIPKSVKAESVEIYDKKRFVTITGVAYRQDPVNERTIELLEIIKEIPAPSEPLKVMNRILSTKDRDGFKKLYEGDISDYPSQSEADLALCGLISKYTTKEKVIDEIMRGSKLFRDKWDKVRSEDGKSYGEMTLSRVLAGKEPDDTRDDTPERELITSICEEHIRGYFKDANNGCYILVPTATGEMLHSTRSSQIEQWMSSLFRETYGQTPTRSSIKDALVPLEAKCQFSERRELFTRTGRCNDTIYYDLCRDNTGVVIGKDGWRIEKLPMIFKREGHQLPQCLPIKGGDVKDILKFIPIRQVDAILFLVDFITMFIPNIPHAIIVFIGEQGTGKSVITKMVKIAIDPSAALLSAPPRDSETFHMLADKHWIVTLDNVSYIQPWLSDCLCRTVTGDGTMKRSLYTDNNEFIRSYRRGVIVNGIGSIIRRPDLLDRSTIFNLPLLVEREAEEILFKQYKEALPGILGGAFTVISEAMGKVESVKGYGKFRMADFARWGGAIAEVLGFTAEEFYKAYDASIQSKYADAVSESPLTEVFNYLINTKCINKDSDYMCWEGSMSDVLGHIKDTGWEKQLPEKAQQLGNMVVRQAPALRNQGIDVQRMEGQRKSGSGQQMYRAVRVVKESEGTTI